MIPGPSGAQPWVQLADLLTPELRSRLADWARVALAKLGPDPSWYRTVGSSTVDPLELDADLRSAFTEAIVGLLPLVRGELAVPHFRPGSVDFVVWVEHPDGSFHGRMSERGAAPGERRIDFVYHLDAGASLPGVTAVANSIVFFPSGVHHELVSSPDAALGAVRVALRGWISADAVDASSVSAVLDPAMRRAELQRRLLPRFSAGGFEIRPIPSPVHDLLRSLLELRGSRRRPEDADRYYHLADDNDLIDVSDLGGEILAALQTLHERFSGVPLVPSALYGMRSYREGARLAMHVDRLETHVVSSVLQVAQDVDECWPLQLTLDGRTHEVVLSPGQMLLYEGASTMHGRVKPLRGRSFVNAFAHYRPVDWAWSESMLWERASIDGG